MQRLGIAVPARTLIPVANADRHQSTTARISKLNESKYGSCLVSFYITTLTVTAKKRWGRITAFAHGKPDRRDGVRANLGASSHFSLVDNTACCNPTLGRQQVVRHAGADPQASQQRASSKQEESKLDEQILALSAPALIALCAEPLFSIVDTSFVGRLPDAALSLAGLAIATTVFDFIFRAYNFLCVVTIPLVAQAAVAKRRGDLDAEDPSQITGRVVGLAGFLGVVTWMLMVSFAPSILQLGGAAPGSSLSTIAAGYLIIRAAALPASLVNTVAVGTFRGQLDTATPLQVVAFETAANVVLDGLLVFGVEPLGIPAMGVNGAALATAVSIWLSCGIYCVILHQRNMIAWTACWTWIDNLGELQPLLVGGSSQLLRTLSLQTVLLQLTRTVSGLDASGVAIAAHQVAIRCWFFALFALDSIAVAAQGLVPTALASAGPADARRVALRLLSWGLGGGVASGLVLGFGYTYIPAVFTDNLNVQENAKPLIALVAVLQPLAGLVFTWDGIFQGLADFTFLAVAMAISAGITLAALQTEALSSSLGGVWVCFALFLFLRAAGLVYRFFDEDGPLAENDEISK